MNHLFPIALFSAFLGTSILQDPPKPVEPPKPVAGEAQKEAPKVLKVGDKLPATLKLRDLDGKEITPATLKDKVVCFVFWSIKCPIMIANEARLTALHKDYAANKDVLVIAVNSNEGNGELGAPPADGAKDTYPNLREYMKNKGMAFQVVADHGGVLGELLAARTTPHSYVFGKDGALRYAGAFDDDERNNKEKRQAWTRDAIEACLAGKDPKVANTEPWGCTIKRAAAGRRGRK